jgi:lysophospholipase L1-like esterase
MAKVPKQRTRATAKRRLADAITRGRAVGARVVQHRAQQRRKRKASRTAAVPRRRLAARSAVIPERTVRALALPPPVGLLIAEGDSWFDYPFHDILSMLEDEHGFDVESVAHKGDTVEDMAYSGGQFDDFARLLEKLLRRGQVPDAILLSGGGNDIAGDEFAILLNHAASGLPTLNGDVVTGVVDIRIKNAYAFLIAGLTEISDRFLDRPIPILLHGYDYPVPDGRGFLGGFSFFPGPWLEPGFHRKGHGNLATNTATVAALIDRFNEMLRQVTGTTGFGHVRFVDLRNTLSAGSGYKRDWANELHPTERGFRMVADRIASAI